MNMDGQYPTYWKNQTKYILQGTTVNGKQYDQGKATDIAIVDGKVVVVGMLTGDYLYNLTEFHMIMVMDQKLTMILVILAYG